MPACPEARSVHHGIIQMVYLPVLGCGIFVVCPAVTGLIHQPLDDFRLRSRLPRIVHDLFYHMAEHCYFHSYFHKSPIVAETCMRKRHYCHAVQARSLII